MMRVLCVAAIGLLLCGCQTGPSPQVQNASIEFEAKEVNCMSKIEEQGYEAAEICVASAFIEFAQAIQMTSQGIEIMRDTNGQRLALAREADDGLIATRELYDSRRSLITQQADIEFQAEGRRIQAVENQRIAQGLADLGEGLESFAPPPTVTTNCTRTYSGMNCTSY